MVDADSRDKSKRRSGVSRRRFVQAAGTSGVALGLAGCIQSQDDGGNGGGNDSGGNGSAEQLDPGAVDNEVTVQWAADSRVADNVDRITEALRNAGLPENISIDILGGSQVTDDRQNQYQTWLNSGQEEPTLLMTDSGWTIPFIVRDQLQNLSQSLPSDWISQVNDNYFGASVETAKHPDSDDLYAIPLFPDFPTIQYRKDLVTDAGYDPEGQNWATESMTWQDFNNMIADVVSQNDDVEMGFNFQAASYEGLSCCDFNEFITGWGGAYFGDHSNLFGPVGDRPITVNEEPVLQSIRMIRTFIHGQDDEHSLDGYQKISPEAVLQWQEDPSKAPFDNGNAVALRNWPYSIVENGAEENYGEDLGVMPIPYAVTPDEAEYEGTGGPSAALGGWHISMNPNSSTEKKNAAAAVIQTMMTDEFNLAMFEILGWIPPKPELLNSDRAAEVPVIGRYLEQLRVAGENAVPRPVTAVWSQQSDQIAQEVNSTYAQQKAPEDAMSSLESTLEQIEQNA
ncbi:extracellular solute-binding protein [Haloprofundus halophilus]|uniref:extracellular solute-binding protein n=1 Tax=Haloprofundus halophilus TaxID=2283527 RepID=UPI000E43BA83